jgi:hypothetical protein
MVVQWSGQVDALPEPASWQVGRNKNVNKNRILDTTINVCFDWASSIFKNKSKFTRILVLGILKGTVNGNCTNANQYLLVKAKN